MSGDIDQMGDAIATVFSGEDIPGLAQDYASQILERLNPSGQRLPAKTLVLRSNILTVLADVEPPVTVRQLFYMVASRGYVSKDGPGYGRVQRQVLAMRREGLIEYGDIADNTRWVIRDTTDSSLACCLERTARFYRQDLWIRSPVYVEVWCEKDSIAGVLQTVTSEYDVPLYPARGYSSETFAYSAGDYMARCGKECHVYYVGDFDPSGWDASRDLEQRLKGFFPEVNFTRLAILPHHIQRYGLITRPTKQADTRTKKFFELFGKGQESCELEAMHPDVLRRFVRIAIEQHIDEGELDALRLEEREAKAVLWQLAHEAAQ